MSKKNTIRLTESQLKRVITESIKNIINENETFGDETDFKNSFIDAVEDAIDNVKNIYVEKYINGEITKPQTTDRNKILDMLNDIWFRYATEGYEYVGF